MTPEQAEIIRQCAHEYPNINGLVPSPENAEAIEEFLDDWGLKLDGDTVVLAEPEYEGPLLVVYMPWCVSGEVVEEAPGHEDEENWAVVELAEYEGFDVIAGGMTYDQAVHYLENGEPDELAHLSALAESTDNFEQRERLIDAMVPLIREQISQA